MTCNVLGDSTELVESILLLHQIYVPPAVIAKRLHITEKVARFVIQRRRLPPQQIELAWEDVPE